MVVLEHLDIPITFASNLLSQVNNQEPLKPRCPVTIIFFFKNIEFHKL